MATIFKKNKKWLAPSVSRGFTLIETFVAITILMIVVLGPMSLLSNALQDSRHIGDQITATFLAQEGVELLIAQRNTTGSINQTNADALSCPLYFGLVSGYNCDSSNNNATIFTRAITIDSNGLLPNQKKITSTITIRPSNGYSPKPISASTIILAN